MARYFYIGKKSKKYYVEGLVLGIVIVAMSILMEIPVMVYGFAADVGWSWFLMWEMWVSYLIVIVASVLALKK